MPERTCNVCGESIEHRHPSALTCSQKCKSRATYLRRAPEARTSEQRGTGTCTVPGCLGKHLARGYCRSHYRKLANPDKPRDRRVTFTCVDCGSSVTKALSAKSSRDRCVPCARRAGLKKRPAAKSNWPQCHVSVSMCTVCGEPFTSKRRRFACSTACEKRRISVMYAKTGRCRECSTPTQTGKYYCDPCRAARNARSRREEARRNGKARNHIDRARKYGVYYEPVNPVIVFRRDKWMCQICWRQIDPDLTFPHPRSKTLDHVVPMSRGGSHTYANTQLACLECNIAKSNKMPPEIMQTTHDARDER